MAFGSAAAPLPDGHRESKKASVDRLSRASDDRTVAKPAATVCGRDCTAAFTKCVGVGGKPHVPNRAQSTRWGRWDATEAATDRRPFVLDKVRPARREADSGQIKPPSSSNSTKKRR
jgi:hypothetical protein